MSKDEYFEQLYQEYHTNIYHFLNRHVQNPAVSEELANDVFVSVYSNLHTYDSSKSFITTWLYAIAGNRLKNYYKSCRFKEYSFDLLIQEPTALMEPEQDEMVRKELGVMLEGMLCRLPERSQKIVRMKYYQGMTSAEIGKYLNLSPGNVRVILKRSLSTLRKMMRRY